MTATTASTARAVLCCALAGWVGAAAAANAAPRVVLHSFGWLENLAFDCTRSNLFASAYLAGEVVRVTANGTVTRHGGKSVFKSVLGLAVDEAAGTVYVAATSANGTHEIASFPSDDPDRITMFAGLPHSVKPNGLGLVASTGYLYTASEGNELPGSGSVYEVSPAGVARKLDAKLWSADGLTIDQATGTLYVGQMFNSKIAAFDVSVPLEHGGATPLGLSDGHGVGILDDFTLAPGGGTIVGAGWTKNAIVSFPAGLNDTAPYRVAATGVEHPTSAKFGCGAWPSTSLFTTEGGHLLKSDARLLEFVDFQP